MTSILVDSNIFFDVIMGEATSAWSTRQLARLGGGNRLAVNPVIWSEIGAAFPSQSALRRALTGLALDLLPLSFEAAFRAGQAHRAYRRAGGERERTLPDFLIGAQAEVEGLVVLTRDPARYRSYFPTIEIVSPETHP
ncbi:MAG: type II toxin-antitoxin system VapC family toxin [Rhizobiaceae bacterium]|nr:type II toxin-antitoxin system VapC family toxin [Rhizobiaceae bacterium]MCV0409053.1 type II toxin-antitoxin system VapC family toxin [Rhizobiaceae bacterium]